jgi:glutaredoxin
MRETSNINILTPFVAEQWIEVVLIHHREELKASNRVSIDIMTPFLAEQWITDQTKLTGVVLKRNDGKKESKTVSCDGAFLMIGATPNTEWIKGQVDLDGDGFVRLEGESATSLSGVFAAGEVADTVYRQAITAAAGGAQAAIDAERWLRKTRGVKKVVGSQTRVKKLNVSTTTVQRNMEERVDKDIECDLISASCIETVVKKYPVVVFSKPWCPYCKRAIEALSIEGVTKPYIVDLASFGPKGPAIQDTLQKITGRRTVPNVFIGGNSIGGGDETTAMQREGKLGPLLKTVGAL